MSNSKKNIVIIGPAHPLRGGGMATFNERMARAFMQQGHAVQIFTFSLQYPNWLFPGSTQYASEPAPEDLQIQVLINSVNPLNWISVGNRLRKLKPDIIIVRYWLPFMGPCLGTILRIARKNKHSKIVCIADNIIPHEKRLGDRAFTKYFIKPVDAFITMSKKVWEDAHAFGVKKPVETVPHPLYDNFGEKIEKSEARKNLSIPDDIFLLLFFGFIRKYKGLDILLDAMPKIAQNIPNARLLIAGEFYGDAKMYEAQIERLGLQNVLYLHNHFIPNEKIKSYICAADLLVQPYRNATQSGVTPLAYHFEVPMLVTRVGGLPDMLPPDSDALIASPNAGSLAEKIIAAEAYGVEKFIPALIENKKNFSWEKFTQSILDIAKQA